MSEPQRDWLLQYGSRGVCVDSTHGTTSMGFPLTTLMTVDDCHKGLPCAFFLSYSDDGKSLELFFQAIFDRLRPLDLHPDIFMSDDAQGFWNAWTSVFGAGSTKKLLCGWHIDKNWKKQLQSKVRDKSNVIQLYHGLYLLLKETSEEKFRQLAPNFLTYVSETEPDFHKYLTENYFAEERLPQWVAWRRLGNEMRCISSDLLLCILLI